MTKTTTTVIKKEEAVEDQDSPAVLAYRVGQLEKTTAAGLKDVKDELIGLRNHFVSKADLKAAQDLADEKHKQQDKAIKALEDWNLWAQRLVIGTVITAVLVLILKGNGVI